MQWVMRYSFLILLVSVMFVEEILWINFASNTHISIVQIISYWNSWRSCFEYVMHAMNNWIPLEHHENSKFSYKSNAYAWQFFSLVAETRKFKMGQWWWSVTQRITVQSKYQLQILAHKNRNKWCGASAIRQNRLFPSFSSLHIVFPVNVCNFSLFVSHNAHTFLAFLNSQ